MSRETGADSLAPLLVLDRLEVAPVRLSPRSVTALYRVTAGGRTDETELAYRYEEDVFDPSEAASVNLASLIAAQVALNYGLFSKELVFHGPFDAHDRRFLAEMAANTAREIYVNKIQRPNEFLLPEAKVPLEVRESYLQSELVFPDSVRDDEPSGRGRTPRGSRARQEGDWRTSRARMAVLSSGGKESLLTYGLLRELGYETHSLFVNESGRHWYTALNGYRHLASVDPERTVRIWTSADRVFNWMVRQLPFVRPDYQRLRSDEYPIRLWTVAVFLFGALPVLRRRGIGRILIGDEHDTTRVASFRGIPHYDGLYDQSRLFDDALSAYYRRKGWGLVQFSIVRQLSELLVEKLLVQRYPELQRHQTSCHATHIEGDRVYPCGRCEKCRRVVAMLVAVGGDPTRCGYSEAQIEGCLRAVAEKAIHQEVPASEHVLWMLRELGRVEADTPRVRRASPRSEVMHLRFDRRRSPAHAIPASLRRPLFATLLEHADGALRRSGRQWIPFDPLTDPSLARPYRFEAAKPADGPEDERPATAARDYLLGELTWPQAKRRFAEVDIALLPVGSIEQHGPHLPLDTDAWDAEHLCREVARRCAEPRPLVLPLIPYGVSYHHEDFPGTLSVGPETLARLVYEIGLSAARHGVAKLIIVNGHGGNMPTLQFAAQMINRDAHIFTCVDTGETSDADVARLSETRGDVHAGEVETSTSLAARPELVDLPRAEGFVPRFYSRYLDFSSDYAVQWYAHTDRISSSGVLGDPSRASAEKGRLIWEVMIRHLVTFVETLKPMTLAEIHERRV